MGWLLDYKLVPIPKSKRDPWWFWEAKWAEVDVNHMRKVREGREAIEFRISNLKPFYFIVRGKGSVRMGSSVCGTSVSQCGR